LQNGVNGIILNDISNHLPVFAISSTKTIACKNEINYYKRDYNEPNFTKFQRKLSQVDWNGVLVGQDPNEIYDSFAAEYHRHFDNCFPPQNN
jgi:hypothetical protein